MQDFAGEPCLVDEFAEVPLDCSDIVWVATANDAARIPEPILNRMNVYEVQMPDHDAARLIALKPAIDHARMVVIGTAQMRQIDIELEMQDPDMQAMADPTLLGQVLVNLLSNALDAIGDRALPVREDEVVEQQGADHVDAQPPSLGSDRQQGPGGEQPHLER